MPAVHSYDVIETRKVRVSATDLIDAYAQAKDQNRWEVVALEVKDHMFDKFG